MTKNHSFITIFLLLLGSSTLYSIVGKKIIQGTIQFPQTVSTLPSVRVYFAGNRLKCETNNITQQITFSLPAEPYQESFFLLITESIEFELEENTVKYLKLPSNQAYKLYKLDCLTENTDVRWKVTEISIPVNTGRIPDGTIIICFNPDYIHRLDSGDMASLPSLIVRHDIINILGSEDKLRDLSSEIILKCLEWDTVHGSVHLAVQHSTPCKTLVLIGP